MLLLLAAACLDLLGAAALAARLLPPPRPTRDRLLAAALLALLLPILEVRLLGLGHGLTRPGMALAIVGTSAALAAIAGGDARCCLGRDARSSARVLAATLTGTLAVWVGLTALALAGLAAYLLPPWTWDGFNYHLPIVHDALRTGTLRVVPTHIPYVNAYPCAVERFFLACRLLLGDDTWLDFCQTPFALAGCLGVAGLAHRRGASAPRAAAYGALFLAVPVVMLQLATAYVDVAVAALLVLGVYFATGPRTRVDLALWAVATGLLLGSKPSTPPAVAILAVFVVARGIRGRDVGPALAACALVALLGGERYLENVVRHGNPIWPIGLHLGPISLPGPAPGGPMFLLGLPEPYAHYGWLHRLLASLAAMPERYIYDMRLGGLGPLVAFGLGPLVVVTAPRTWRGAGAVALLALAAVASPAAHWMRYTLALPAALLAHVAVISERWPRRTRRFVDLGLAALAALGVAQATPGLTNNGVSLATLLALSPEERAPIVSVDGHEALWIGARRLVGPGEAFAHDASFTFPGQLWTGDPRAGLVFLGDAPAPADADAALERDHVRVLVAGDGLPGAAAVERDPARYRALFRCPVDRCTVYERLTEAAKSDAP